MKNLQCNLYLSAPPAVNTVYLPTHQCPDSPRIHLTLGTKEKERQAILWQCNGCGSLLTGFKKRLTGLDRTYVSQEEKKFCPCPRVHFLR